MHEPYDSIQRNVYDVIPVVPSHDEDLTAVMFPFTETRYRKDGEIEVDFMKVPYQRWKNCWSQKVESRRIRLF